MPGSALELSPPSILASGGALFATSPPRLQGLPSTPLSAILRFSAMEFNCTTYRIFDATWRLLLLMCVMVSMAADSSSPVGWIIIVVAGSPLSSVEGGSAYAETPATSLILTTLWRSYLSAASIESSVYPVAVSCQDCFGLQRHGPTDVMCRSLPLRHVTAVCESHLDLHVMATRPRLDR